ALSDPATISISEIARPSISSLDSPPPIGSQSGSNPGRQADSSSRQRTDLIPGNAVSAPTSTDDTSLDAGPFGPSEDLPRNTGSPSGGESSRDAQAGGGAGTPSEHQDSKAPELPSPFNIEANSGTPSAPAGSAVGPAQPLSTQVSPATTSASSSTSPT